MIANTLKKYCLLPNKRLILIFALLIAGSSWGQTYWKQTQTIKLKASEIYLDPVNNLYAVNKGEISKHDEQGKLLTKYSDKLIGNELILDVSNPMKVLLFSPEQMKLVFLDSRLGELQSEMNLFNQGYEQVSLAATSHSNGFWLYDPINFIMIRYDQFSNESHRSFNLAQMLRLEFFPSDMREHKNKVYLTDPDHGVFVFDIYGNYIKRIPIKDIEKLRISNDRLFYMKENQLLAFNLIDGSEQKVVLPKILSNSYSVNRNRIVESTGEEIFIFTPKP